MLLNDSPLNSVESKSLDTIDILLVDDRVENLLALESILNLPDYRLIKATSGVAALKYLLDHEPALILMDVQMPEMNGFDTTAMIKKNPRTRDIPIVFITAINNDEHYLHKGYDYGAVDYLYKPVDSHILLSKVSVFAELHRKTARLVQAEKLLRENERSEREREMAKLEVRSLRREQAAQKRYLDLVDGINHGIVWSAEASSRALTFVSDSIRKISGHASDYCMSTPDFWDTWVHPDDRTQMQSAFEALTKGKREVSLEHRILTQTGNTLWLQTSMRYDDSAPDSPQIRGLSIDIDRLKQVESELQVAKRQSDLLAEASLALSESLDPEVTLQKVGAIAVPTFADRFILLGMEDDDKIQLLNVTASDSVAQQLTRSFIAHLEHRQENPLSVAAKSGRARIINSADPSFAELGIGSGMLIPLESRGRCFGLMILALDQTNRSFSTADLQMGMDLGRRIAMALDSSRLYMAAQVAVRLRDEFLSIASHELKTPLTPLKLQTQALLRTLTAPGEWTSEQQSRILRMIQSSDRQLDRLAKLVEEMLDIARITNGKLSLELERFNVSALIKEVLDRFSDQVKPSENLVRLEIPDELWVTLDRIRVEQVIVNLLTNALKYGNNQPISISAEAAGDFMSLRFIDHGIGIAKEDQKRIFDRYERAAAPGHVSGLGLGLYIVSQIVRAHGGAISIQSEVGKGSVFTVKLPIHFQNLDSGHPIAL